MSSKSTSDTNQRFEAFYLKRVTNELAEDLDKVRGADDFKDESAVPMLIYALLQGTQTFTADEKMRIVNA